jgi:hypothetical protein
MSPGPGFAQSSSFTSLRPPPQLRLRGSFATLRGLDFTSVTAAYTLQMFDDLVAQYHEGVVAAFLEYRTVATDGVAGRSRDLRRAMEAATVLFHFREHLPGPPNRAEVEAQCPEYALLGDMVNATKHKVVDRNTPHGPPLVRSATNLFERLVSIEYIVEEGSYRVVEKVVVVALTDKSERNVLEVLTRVVNHWEERLHALGLLKEARNFRFDDPIRYRSRQQCQGQRISFEVVQGHRFQYQMQVLRFDNEMQRALPVDMTGATVKATIRKPSFDFEVILRHEATGLELRRKVDLSDDECAELAMLDSDAEREEAALRLPSSQAALRTLAEEVAQRQAQIAPRSGEIPA